MRRTLLVAVLASATAVCARAGPPLPPGAAVGPVALEVISAHYNDVKIYVTQDGGWTQLGIVTVGQSARFTIPGRLTGTATGFRILLDPIGSPYSHLTDRIIAGPGDVIHLQVASTLHMSTWWLG